MKRSKLLLTAAVTILSMLMSATVLLAAPYYEGKMIRIVVGSEPGGGYDRMARLIAKYLPRYIPGKPVMVVENMAGAGSIVAANHLYSLAKRDGLTIGAPQRGIPFAQLTKAEGVKFDVTKYAWIGSPSVLARLARFPDAVARPASEQEVESLLAFAKELAAALSKRGKKVSLTRRSDQVLYQMSRAYEELGQVDPAMKVMDRLVKEYPESRYRDEVQFRRAEYLYTRRHYLDAEDAYGSVVKMGAQSPFYQLALYKLGWTFYKQELYEEALDKYIALLDHKVSVGYDFTRPRMSRRKSASMTPSEPSACAFPTCMETPRRQVL
jgi:tetratricopeptide (TPR) repeat protein